MQLVALIASICATLALAFGAWERFTATGRLQVDEMAGILPFVSWYAGLALALLAAICRVLLARRSRRRDSQATSHGDD